MQLEYLRIFRISINVKIIYYNNKIPSLLLVYALKKKKNVTAAGLKDRSDYLFKMHFETFYNTFF